MVDRRTVPPHPSARCRCPHFALFHDARYRFAVKEVKDVQEDACIAELIALNHLEAQIQIDVYHPVSAANRATRGCHAGVPQRRLTEGVHLRSEGTRGICQLGILRAIPT